MDRYLCDFVARVEEDRGLAIEAAIVRVMKSRKMLNYTNLIQEVLGILRQFKPDPKVNFLQRDRIN
jgi:hypothetical protein